ncbi:MAG: hypothetical protein JRF63_05925 [Deltaproteobacteria bacterium]|nr:hypothetical protein [Deltaproteobacteria bacterium]
MINRRRPLLRALALALAVAFALVSVATHAKTRKRRVGIRITKSDVRATFSYRDVFSKKVREKLTSGLPTRTVVQVALQSKDKKKPVTYWARAIEVVYDLWEEDFVITVEDARGRRRTRVKTAEEAINVAGLLWRTPIASIKGLKPGMYRLQFVAEANPVSKEMVENIRRWLSRPSGGHGSETRSNFFGSFVGSFVDRNIGKADKTVSFVSQWFEVKGR